MIGEHSIRLLIFQLKQAGFFTYVVPFLIVLLVLLGLLWKTRLFTNPLIDISLAILFALMLVSWRPFISGQFASFLGDMIRSLLILVVLALFVILLDYMITGGSLMRHFTSNTWITGIVLCVVGFLFVISDGLRLVLGPYGAAAVRDVIADNAVVLIFSSVFLVWLVSTR